MSYVHNVLIWATQSLNTMSGGDPDQTFSSRSYEARLRGKAWGYIAVPLIDLLFYPFGGWGHCARAFDADTERTYASV